MVAPIDGTVLSVNVELGQQASAGTVAATLADTANVRLVVNVEQKDISRIYPGQFVDISVFALPDEQFGRHRRSRVSRLPAGTGFVTFPVIIVLTDGPMEMLLPGMTASAVFQEGEAPTADEPATDESAADEPATAEPASEPTDEEAVDKPAETGESAPEADESAEEADTEPDAETAAPDASGD